jgi:hypothetical protein
MPPDNRKGPGDDSEALPNSIHLAADSSSIVEVSDISTVRGAS